MLMGFKQPLKHCNELSSKKTNSFLPSVLMLRKLILISLGEKGLKLIVH